MLKASSINPFTLLFYVPTICFINRPVGTILRLIMKATIFLTYEDDSEVSFEFKSYDSKNNALALLYTVCRGTLMASIAVKVQAFNEDGFDVCTYVK